MLSFDSYVALMIPMLQIELDPCTNRHLEPQHRVALDSLQFFELIIQTEELAGISNPTADIPMITSWGDAFAYYQQCVELARSR